MRAKNNHTIVNKPKNKRPTPLTMKAVTRIAKTTALRQGGHEPVVIVEGNNRITCPLPALANTPEKRMRQLFAAGYALAQQRSVGKLKQAFFISEAWVSVSSKGNLPTVPPSRDANRKEVLIVTSLSLESGKSGVAMLEMVRDAARRLVKVQPLQHVQGGAGEVESPLMRALVAGFQAGSGDVKGGEKR